MAENGKDPATKADLLSLEQRLDQKMDRMARQVVVSQAKIQEISDKVGGMATKDDVRRILNAIDDFAGKAKSYDRAAVLHGHALTEVEVKLKDHDKRIKTLESARR